MFQSRVFVFLSITLFLAGCLSAEAGGDTSAPVNRDTAVEKVEALKELTKEVLRNAEGNLTKAENTKLTVKEQKDKAVSAESAAKAAAAEIKAEQRKTEAAAVAEKATAELANCDKLHQAAKEKAEGASTALNGFVERAKVLVQNAEIAIPDASVPTENYAQVVEKAEIVTSNTKTLIGDIDQSSALSATESALSQLKNSASKIQVFKHRAESIAIVSRIESALKTGETDIQSIEGKKEEIDTIVQAVNIKCKSASGSSKRSLSSLCTTAKSQLQTAADKVQEAQQYSKDIQGKKAQVVTDLTTLINTDDETQAGGEAEKIRGHEGFIDGELKKIKGALQAADDAFNSAKGVQQQMQTEISQHNSQSGSELNNKKQQDNEPREAVTNSIPNGEAKNPAITESDKASLGKSAKTMDKASEQPGDANLENTKQNQSTEVTHTEKPNPRDDNSELLNNDQLRNITKDITKNPLIGGGVPKRSAANDSAVTVFIPLLVILVISAVMH